MDWNTYAKDAKPSAGFESKLAALPDGDYLFEVQKVEMKATKGGSNIVEAVVKVLTPGPHDGMEAEWAAAIIKDQDGANRWIGTLEKLGYDPTFMKHGDGNEQMGKALRIFCGMRFMGKKKQSETKNAQGEFYQNINVISRADDGKPAKIGLKELDELGAAVAF